MFDNVLNDFKIENISVLERPRKNIMPLCKLWLAGVLMKQTVIGSK